MDKERIDRNDRHKHHFPGPHNFPTPEQLQNSMDSISSKDLRYGEYTSMIPEAKSRLAEWLKDNKKAGALSPSLIREFERQLKE